MSGNKGKTSRRGWESPHSGSTQGFPLIHYDPLVPISKDLIDAATSWVLANYKYIHEGMDGKSPRFNILSKKPTRERLIAERAATISAFPSLDELGASLRSGPIREYHQVGLTVSPSEGDDSVSSSSAPKLSKSEESEMAKELEIRLNHWLKQEDKVIEHLQNFFGVVRGNQTADSKDIVEKARSEMESYQ